LWAVFPGRYHYNLITIQGNHARTGFWRVVAVALDNDKEKTRSTNFVVNIIKKILMMIAGFALIGVFGFLINFTIPVFIALSFILAPLVLFVEKPLLERLKNCLRSVLIVPFLVAGILAPLRAIFVALHIFFEMPVDVIVEDFYPALLPWLNTGLGAVGTVFGIVGGFIAVFLPLRQLRQVVNLPTSKARSAALGLAEFEGVARRVEGEKRTAENDGPDSGRWVGMPEDRILFWGTKWVREEGEEGHTISSIQEWSRFWLEDDTGRILVDPQGVEFEDALGTIFFESVRKILLTKKRNSYSDNIGHNGVTRLLIPGDPVYLIGSVEINEDAPPEASDSERLIIRPSSELKQTAIWRRWLLGDAEKSPGTDVSDIFFLADGNENEAYEALKKGIKSVAVLATVWAASSLWLFLYSAPW